MRKRILWTAIHLAIAAFFAWCLGFSWERTFYLFMTISFLNAAGDWFSGKMNQPFRKVEFNLRPKLESIIEKASDAFTVEDRSLLAERIHEALSANDWITFTWLQPGLVYFNNWSRFEGDIRLNVLIKRTGYDQLFIGRQKTGYEICYSVGSTSLHPKEIVLGTIPYRFFEVMQSGDQYDLILERKLDKPLRANGWAVKDDDSFLAETDFLYMRWRILE